MSTSIFERPIVLIDLDDTVFDLEGHVYRYMQKNFADKGWVIPPQDRTQYALSYQYDELFGTEVGDIVRAFQQSEQFFESMEFNPGAYDAIMEMASKGIEIRFCSTPYLLNSTVHTQKAKSILNKFDQMAGTGDFWQRRLNLTHFKNETYGHILIDDKPHMERKHHTNWVQVHFPQTYNLGCEPRMKDWQSWAETIEPLLVEQGFVFEDGKWGRTIDTPSINGPRFPRLSNFIDRLVEAAGFSGDYTQMI